MNDYKVMCNFKKDDLSEGMWIIHESLSGWWKPRYLINENTKCAYEILNESKAYVCITVYDILLNSIISLPADAVGRAMGLSAHYPTHIGSFKNGVAEVSWQLNPDGRYYMDDDGYGMSSDMEINIYGFIDTRMNVLVKFQYIDNNWDRLKEMRSEAEEKYRRYNG